MKSDLLFNSSCILYSKSDWLWKPLTPLKTNKEKTHRKSHSVPELCVCSQWKALVLVGGRAAIGVLTGPTVTCCCPDRESTWERNEITELLLSLFQAWKAHLMGREGCKQNSRRTAVSQRTQPAQGKAFITPPAYTHLPNAQCERYTECPCLLVKMSCYSFSTMISCHKAQNEAHTNSDRFNMKTSVVGVPLWLIFSNC